MASIFTYDPDPPRVSSPWPDAVSSGRVTPAHNFNVDGLSSHLIGDITADQAELLEANQSTRLEAEPQEGPTEYKLHLLLRPRTASPASGFTRHVPGSQHSKSASTASSVIQPSSLLASGPAASSSVPRQHRLEQLTTQLLWRLQQSSPYHATSTNNLVLPELPKALPELQLPERIARLTPGLEGSKGALYEIGVTDDGTLVGLTIEEMRESLNNLRAMAASLGCTVEVKRMICVGQRLSTDPAEQRGKDITKLFVSEAFVGPLLNHRDQREGDLATGATETSPGLKQADASLVEQLRVSLTGATTCGKSSLLGTLSTSTLDNGRGKSRLSLLKHRHEIASGVTSSVAQELLGYYTTTGDDPSPVKVLNYADGNVSTWNDIHASADLSRLALLVDSAGHPRFRRTTVRGLVGWAPHWTFLCVAANEESAPLDSPSYETGGEAQSPAFSGANAHISMAHLDLCLKLSLPLVVVITKLDEAKRSSFTQLLSTLLTALKDAGRRPVMISNSDGQTTEQTLQTISAGDYKEIRRVTEHLSTDPSNTTVPLIFTSAVKGTGIGKLHALLCCLPIPHGTGREQDVCGRSTFHIDDSFDVPMQSSTNGSVVSGYLTHGHISIGDVLALGPFLSNGAQTTSQNTPPLAPNDPTGPFLSPRSFSDALAKTTSSPRLRPSDPANDWKQVKIVSIRNLRLPVRTLQADQVGTVGIVPIDGSSDPLMPIRKGMVLTTGAPTATHTFTARFAAEEASSIVLGTVVIIYCASVRAGARVVAVALDASHPGVSASQEDQYGRWHRASVGVFEESAAGSLDEGEAFLLDEELEQRQSEDTSHSRGAVDALYIRATLQFVAYREWIETGAKVLVMPSGGLASDRYGAKRAMAGLEGFVGKVVETFG